MLFLPAEEGEKSNEGTVIMLYLLGTFAAALVSVLDGFVFPLEIDLAKTDESLSPPDGIGLVLKQLLLKLV